MTYSWTVERSRALMVHLGKLSTKYGVFVCSHGSWASSLHSCLKAILAKNHEPFSPNVILENECKNQTRIAFVFCGSARLQWLL